MEKLRLEASCTAAIMPAQQGVLRWPRYNPHNEKDQFGRFRGNLTCLSHEAYLPLKDGSIDRIIVAHCLENTERSNRFLREVWRTLSPGGRVIVIVPNRSGFWTKSDKTPFGHGTPFSNNQIKKMLSDNMLTPINWTTALSLPPFKNRTMLSVMTPFETTGLKWWKKLSGALIIEAEKQIYAHGIPAPAAKKIKKPAIAHSHSNPHRRFHKNL
jgi:SAM-dependent methyltransferase